MSTFWRDCNSNWQSIILGRNMSRPLETLLLRSTRTHLENLYRALIAPIRESLSVAHLVIAPHGILHNLPFQALFDGERYLIDEFTISYAPSASVYAICQARPADRQRLFDSWDS